MTLIDKAEALLPCPFCGGEAAYKEYTGEYQNRVFCTACPLEMWGTWLEDPSILAAWNRRALPARGMGVDAVAVKNAVMGWVWAEDSDVSKRLGPKHTDALIARILAALEPAPTDAAQAREAAIRECADALRKVIDYAAFAGADPDEVEDAAINSYADYLLTLIGEKPREQRE